MYVSLSPFDRKKCFTCNFSLLFSFSSTGILIRILATLQKLETGIKGQQETQIYFLLFRPTAQVSSPIVGGFKFACPCRRWCCCVLQVLIDVNLVPRTAIAIAAAAALTAAAAGAPRRLAQACRGGRSGNGSMAAAEGLRRRCAPLLWPLQLVPNNGGSRGGGVNAVVVPSVAAAA